jgi:hypothetical protein
MVALISRLKLPLLVSIQYTCHLWAAFSADLRELAISNADGQFRESRAAIAGTNRASVIIVGPQRRECGHPAIGSQIEPFVVAGRLYVKTKLWHYGVFSPSRDENLHEET